jgi:hypothetical protein
MRRLWDRVMAWGVGVVDTSRGLQYAFLLAVVGLVVMLAIMFTGPPVSQIFSEHAPLYAPPLPLLPPGALVRTTVPTGLRLRDDASREANIIATLPEGEQLFIADHPGELSPLNDGYLDWYRVEWNPGGVPWPSGNVANPVSTKSGFVASGLPVDAVTYLELVPVVCDTEAPTLTSLALMTPYARSVCFGGRTLTILGRAVSGFGGPLEPGTGGPPEPGTYAPPWLFGFGSIGGIANHDALFIYRYQPGLELPAIADGTTVVVTGHFDDPASASCVVEADGLHSSRPETAQTYCAEQFVATHIALASQ